MVAEYVDMDYSDADMLSPALKPLMSPAKKFYKKIFPQFVIQKYMEMPALYMGHKFDIRAHALLT